MNVQFNFGHAANELFQGHRFFLKRDPQFINARNYATDVDQPEISGGDGNFSNSGQDLGLTSTEQVALGDVDLDGDLDLFVGNTMEWGGDPADEIRTNDGQGVFTDSGQRIGKTVSFGAAFGDVDGDGDPDLLVGSSRESPENKLYFNVAAINYMPVIMSEG